VRATCYHAGQTVGPAISQDVPDCRIARSVAQFRRTARYVLDQPERYLLINFSRATLSDNNACGGPFSPLAAYNGRADDLLVLDVARGKFQALAEHRGMKRAGRVTTLCYQYQLSGLLGRVAVAATRGQAFKVGREESMRRSRTSSRLRSTPSMASKSRVR